MATLSKPFVPVPAPARPSWWHTHGISHWTKRVRVMLVTFVDILAECRELERTAHKRYPFSEW